MGIELLKKRSKSFKKAWDGGAERIAEPDLFTKAPSCPARKLLLEMRPDIQLEANEKLIAQIQNDALVASRDDGKIVGQVTH